MNKHKNPVMMPSLFLLSLTNSSYHIGESSITSPTKIMLMFVKVSKVEFEE